MPQWGELVPVLHLAVRRPGAGPVPWMVLALGAAAALFVVGSLLMGLFFSLVLSDYPPSDLGDYLVVLLLVTVLVGTPLVAGAGVAWLASRQASVDGT